MSLRIRTSCYATLLVLLSFCAGCNASVASRCPDTSPGDYYGVYTVQSAERYRGGLTPEEQAKARIGTRVYFTEERLETEALSIDYPVVSLKCYSAEDEEGSVASHRWSHHYGVGVDREVIVVLKLYEPGDDQPLYHFEVVGRELWEFFDGWHYRLEQTR